MALGSSPAGTREERREKGGLKTVGIIEGLYLELCWLASPSASPTPTQITGGLALTLRPKARELKEQMTWGKPSHLVGVQPAHSRALL